MKLQKTEDETVDILFLVRRENIIIMAERERKGPGARNSGGGGTLVPRMHLDRPTAHCLVLSAQGLCTPQEASDSGQKPSNFDLQAGWQPHRGQRTAGVQEGSRLVLRGQIFPFRDPSWV